MNIHITSSGNCNIAFCPSSLKAITIDDTLTDALLHYAKTENITQAASASGISPSLLEYTIQLLMPDQLLATSLSNDLVHGTDHPRILDRLVLHVCNDCNLRCAYCYAEGGSYGGSRGKMPTEVAFTAINWALTEFAGIRTIQFFGGEPLLNPRLIIEVCEYFKALQDKGEIQSLPKFSLVTNGTVWDRRMIELLRRYDISITISIDGPQEIHDVLRGKGSFDKADNLAKRGMDCGLNVSFECTWTTVHVAHGVSVIDLMNFFHDRYGVEILHVVPVSASKDSTLRLDNNFVISAFVDAARYSVQNIKSGQRLANSFSYRVISALATKQSISNYCPAGINTLAVSADGGVFPCFMFVGNDCFRLLKLSAGGDVKIDQRDSVTKLVNYCQKCQHPECASCWAAPLCFGCMGADFLETGSVAQHAKCDLMRSVIEAILIELASHHTNEGQREETSVLVSA